MEDSLSTFFPKLYFLLEFARILPFVVRGGEIYPRKEVLCGAMMYVPREDEQSWFLSYEWMRYCFREREMKLLLDKEQVGIFWSSAFSLSLRVYFYFPRSDWSEGKSFPI